MTSASIEGEKTARVPAQAAAYRTWGESFRSPLGRSLVFATVFCSSILALMMTGIQLYVEYHNDRHSLDQSVMKVKVAVVPSLVESLWIIDDVLVERQLEGIVQLQGIEYAHIENAGRIEASSGVVSQDFNTRYEIPLVRVSGSQRNMLGTLHLSVSHEQIIRDTIQRATLIFSTNVGKTLVVAIIILRLYQNLIGRHIFHLAGYTSAYDPRNPSPPVALDRPEGTAQDELSLLEGAINRWSTANRNYLKRLRRANDTLAERHRELTAANQQLHDVNREQAEFTYAISHDLKSPTNTLGMLIQELEECEGLSDDAQDVLSDMISTNARMGKLVEDVLQYSRIVEERRRIEPVDLNAVAQEIQKDLSADIATADAQIETDALPSIEGDPMQLRILMQNLIANAIKFRSPDRPAHVRISGSADASGSTIKISDNGIGIPREYREKVFGLFQRLHARSSYEGSGLGLAVCKRIVANHHGTIALSDGIDGGTTFTMTFRRQ